MKKTLEPNFDFAHYYLLYDSQRVHLRTLKKIYISSHLITHCHRIRRATINLQNTYWPVSTPVHYSTIIVFEQATGENRILLSVRYQFIYDNDEPPIVKITNAPLFNEPF